MRREHIIYPLDMPVTISYCSIEDYPIHWHNAIEIIFVLKGTINVTIDSDTYEIEEKEMEVINNNEAHRIFSKDPDNRVLIFHMDSSFFEKYYNDIENMFFYLNSSDEGAQESQEYEDLRIFLSIILCEAIQKREDYDEEIESTLIDMLYHLINNFHYLTYEKEELKDNEEQLERYHRIAKYIFNNYNNKISLQEIAKKEFLSADYLSHEIKNATGYSFTDLLNLTRVEESIKLLLDSNMSISEISDEVGFSHTRYYNKNFKFYYKCTPLQYKKKYKLDEKSYEKAKKLTYLETSEALKFLYPYLEDYDRFNYENRIHKIHINMDEEISPFSDDFRKVINVGDAFDLLIEDNKDNLEEIQEEISFRYGRIFNLFHRDMGIFPGSSFYNWNKTKTVFEFMEYIELIPLVLLEQLELTDEELINAFHSYVEYFSEIESIDFYNIKYQFHSDFPSELKNEIIKILEENSLEYEDEGYIGNHLEINKIYDSAYMIPYIIHQVANNNISLNFIRAFDVLEKEVVLTNEVFFGSSGLVNDMGIKKPSYYAYYLLGKLGDILVQKGDGYLVTKSEDEYQILLYNYGEELNNLISYETLEKRRGIKNTTEKKISLNIVNINSNAQITTYILNEKIGSSYNYWLGMGKPIRLNKEEREILHKASFPGINFRYTKKSSVLNLLPKLKGYGAHLIIIKKV
ncbi:helix-turn-helix domain-containing protein [Clostridium sp. 'White wine YQ']|uniref:helix-turn-helix domain-containing protein n=1 Tax=Clostridium sp. 'White wine YQ' TaxID=3027474 RepID=UPI0023670BB7|nr:helix-turn-helix domain-containing protein [Clostridium sp. 'White wine YQ']MDD7792940.1 helix-turn-helix domain-containing protein [Clostridium sp. 'White wine YQ']